MYRADAIVFATPNYWTAASAQLKAFLDRLVSAVDWDFERRPTGFRSLLAGRKAAVLVAQDARQAAGANALLHFFELFFRDVELESAGAVVLTDAPHHEAPEAGERAEVLAEARALGRKLVASAGCSPSIS